MTNEDLPPLFFDADAGAGRAQNRHFALQRLELAAIVVGAVVLEFSWSTDGYDLAGLLGAALLAVALLARIVGRITGYEPRWHRARSTAEALKALAWQYAVGGGQYPGVMPDQEAQASVIQAMSEFEETRDAVMSDPTVGMTDAMSQLRRAPLEERRQVYIEHRLLDQRDWYSTTAATNKRATHVWSALVVGLETLAVATAVALGFRWFEFDWASVLGAVAAAGLAWHQAKQHSYLAASYSSAADIVTALTSRFQTEPTADEWADLVGEAETFLASEHALWRNRRT